MSWQRELQPTPDCLPFDRFGEALTAAERDHLAHCVRCETEMALWQEFRDATPRSDEGAAVQWVVAEVGRRRSSTSTTPARRPSWRHWFGAPWIRPVAVAATLVVAVGVGYVLQDREPSIDVTPSSGDVYRSTRIESPAPTGDLAAPPSVFTWVPVAGAASYDVVVLEVDRTILWRTATREARLELPSSVMAHFVAGKAILWEVTARGPDGAMLAESGTQRFRVAASTVP